MKKNLMLIPVLLFLCVSFPVYSLAATLVHAKGATQDTVTFTLKVHAAKMSALENAMGQCGSEAVERISNWILSGPKVSDSTIEVQETREGPITTIHPFEIQASAEFKCLPGLTPDLN
jgi:hypothetical protein